MQTLAVHLMRSGAELPRYASELAAGLDLCACIERTLTVPAGGTVKVPTGVAVALTPGYEGQVRPRSGLAAKHGVTVLNAPGTIDADYRGEISVLLVNLGPDAFRIENKMRVAQLVVAPVTQVTVQSVASLAELGVTSRGDGGFGSTGA